MEMNKETAFLSFLETQNKSNITFDYEDNYENSQSCSLSNTTIDIDGCLIDSDNVNDPNDNTNKDHDIVMDEINEEESSHEDSSDANGGDGSEWSREDQEKVC